MCGVDATAVAAAVAAVKVLCVGVKLLVSLSLPLSPSRSLALVRSVLLWAKIHNNFVHIAIIYEAFFFLHLISVYYQPDLIMYHWVVLSVALNQFPTCASIWCFFYEFISLLFNIGRSQFDFCIQHFFFSSFRFSKPNAKNWMEAAMQKKNYIKNWYVQLQRSFCSQHTWMIFKEDAKKNVTQRKSTLESMINICLQLNIGSSNGSGFAWEAKSMKKKIVQATISQHNTSFQTYSRLPVGL